MSVQDVELKDRTPASWPFLHTRGPPESPCRRGKAGQLCPPEGHDPVGSPAPAVRISLLPDPPLPSRPGPAAHAHLCGPRSTPCVWLPGRDRGRAPPPLSAPQNAGHTALSGIPQGRGRAGPWPRSRTPAPAPPHLAGRLLPDLGLEAQHARRDAAVPEATVVAHPRVQHTHVQLPQRSGQLAAALCQPPAGYAAPRPHGHGLVPTGQGQGSDGPAAPHLPVQLQETGGAGGRGPREGGLGSGSLLPPPSTRT